MARDRLRGLAFVASAWLFLATGSSLTRAEITRAAASPSSSSAPALRLKKALHPPPPPPLELEPELELPRGVSLLGPPREQGKEDGGDLGGENLPEKEEEAEAEEMVDKGTQAPLEPGLEGTGGAAKGRAWGALGSPNRVGQGMGKSRGTRGREAQPGKGMDMERMPLGRFRALRSRRESQDLDPESPAPEGEGVVPLGGGGLALTEGPKAPRGQSKGSKEEGRMGKLRGGGGGGGGGSEELRLTSTTFALNGDSAHNQAMVHWSGYNSSRLKSHQKVAPLKSYSA